MDEVIKQQSEHQKIREGFKDEAIASWAAYRETGLHLTGREVRSWLNSWGSEDEGECPQCHD